VGDKGEDLLYVPLHLGVGDNATSVSMCPWYETFRKVVVFDGLQYPLLSHAGTETYACTHGVHGGGIVPPSLAPLVHDGRWLNTWSVDHSR